MTPQTLWSYEDAGHTQDAKKQILALFGSEVFLTPKPEHLMQLILHIATNPGYLVLDSFLGSGTTAAVAHKMGRRYIGIEMGVHAVSHCVPRLKQVIDGEQGGISKSVGWQGGGGFRFYRLGPPVFDAAGQIRAVEYKDAHIAEGSDTAEKRAIGELWQRKSGGRGLFIVVEKIVNGKDVRQQLEDLILTRSPNVAPTRE